MFQEVSGLKDQYDILIKSAAVSDYGVESVANQKLKKSGDRLTLEFVMNQDILAYAGQHKLPHQVVCGFAMETENLVEFATKKLINKKADMIVANQLTDEGAGFNKDTNLVTFITESNCEKLDLMSKEAVGYEILSRLMTMLMEKRGEVC